MRKITEEMVEYADTRCKQCCTKYGECCSDCAKKCGAWKAGFETAKKIYKESEEDGKQGR